MSKAHQRGAGSSPLIRHGVGDRPSPQRCSSVARRRCPVLGGATPYRRITA